jgi:hypothetical protein
LPEREEGGRRRERERERKREREEFIICVIFRVLKTLKKIQADLQAA